MLSSYTNTYFPLCSFTICLVVNIIFFSRKKIMTNETKIYSELIIFNLIEALLMLSINTLGIFYFSEDTVWLFSFLNKALYAVYIIWHNILFVYVASVTNFKNDKIFKYGCIIFDIVIILLIFISPIELYFENYLSNSSGQSANFLYLGCLAYLTLIMWVLINNIINNTNNIKNKKFYPIYVLFLVQTFTIIVKVKDPLFNISSNTLSLVALIMYFTIENPDIQMLEELSKNKRIIEKQNEDSSNFMFRMTQEVREPIKNLIKVTNNMMNSSKLDDIKEDTILVNKKLQDLDFIVNDVLDLSSITTGVTKIIDSKYNFYNLMNEIKIQTENLTTKDIKFEFYISDNVPKLLYGDSIKLKQIITSIINNSIEHTKSGFVSLEVNSLVKYDAVRLLINISDTGSGISIEEINNILSFNENNDNNIDIDNNKLDVRDIKRILPLINGSMNIKSDIGKGTAISLAINQKIVETNEQEISNKLNIYEQTFYNNKRILLFDENPKELNEVKKLLEKYDVDISPILFANDVKEIIKSGKKFDLLIFNDNNEKVSGYQLLKELTNDCNLKIPVVIMIDNDKEFIKQHYIKDGFSDVLLKYDLKEEINRIVNKY